MAGNELGQRERSDKVRLDDLAKVVDCLLEGRDHRGDAGVVDEAVDAPALFDDARDGRRALLCVGDVADHRGEQAALLAEFRQALRATRDGDDARAAITQRARQCPSQTRACTGDEDDPVGELPPPVFALGDNAGSAWIN